MKTSVMEVRDMLSVLSVLGVEKRIGEVPGVESVTVNYAVGNATVRFDETRLSLADIRSDVRQSGSKDNAAADGDKDSEEPDARAADSKPGAAKSPPAAASADGTADAPVDAKPAGGAPAGSTPPDKAAAGAKPPATPPSSAGATPATDEPPTGKTGKS